MDWYCPLVDEICHAQILEEDKNGLLLHKCEAYNCEHKTRKKVYYLLVDLDRMC